MCSARWHKDVGEFADNATHESLKEGRRRRGNRAM